MALVAATLASELESMVPVGTEVEAINNFATAWENYFSNASIAGVPTNPGTLTAATTAMKGALVGMSSDDQGVAKLQAGIIAFWGSVTASVVTIWTVVPPLLSATPPPLLSTIVSSLSLVFASNISGELSLTQCVTNIANVLHPLQLGGLALQAGTPPVSLPIL